MDYFAKLQEQLQNLMFKKKQIILVVKTRKQADTLALFFSQKNFLAISHQGLRKPWQKAETFSAFNAKEFNIIFCTTCQSMYSLNYDICLDF